MSNKDVLPPGTILSERYEIVKRLGKGGMGSVYLAKDQRLSNTLRAVKQMVVEFVDMDQYTKAIDDFRREAEVLASLDHPSIPSIYDYFVQEGYYYLVMKCVSGKDLEQLLEATPGGIIDEKRVTKWGVQLCDVFQYIHSRTPPIIYRDMKPANVMYDEEADRLYIIDFGIARFVASSQANVTAIGTVGYAPPELFIGMVTPATDIYSLGASLIHLLVGHCPVSHPVHGFNFGTNPSPNQINPKLSQGINEILVKSVAPRARDRYASALEMKQALERHLYSLDAPAPIVVATPSTPESLNAVVNIIHCNTLKTASFPLRKENSIIGRFDVSSGVAPEIDLANYDTSGKVSRRHARIVWDSGKFYFEDTGSANGSLYNGEKVTAQQRYQLKTGDQICVGETIMEYTQ
ncbi:MAG: protein kinase [Acidobacteria bacterium]|nr:protein kinase [Acidobacteriota bacterium]